MTDYNAHHGANLGVKLRVWGGFTAPDWAKNIDGPAITITGKSIVDPTRLQPPDDRPVLDRRLRRCLEQPAE